MEYSYICTCGYESKITEKELFADGKLICQRCLRVSGVSAAPDAPNSRWDPMLSPEQERAAYCREKAVLTLGGAGTGKTRVLTARALYLLREVHIPARNVAILTSSRTSAEDIARSLKANGIHALHEIRRQSDQRFCRIELPHPDLLSISTFYSFCLDLMENFCGLYFTGDESRDRDIRDQNLIDRDDQCAVIRKLRNGLGLPGKTLSALVPEAEELRGILTYASNARIGIDEYYKRRPPAHPETVEHVKKLAAMYAAYKEDNAEIDIDDILAITASTLEASALFREELRKQVLHVLVDDIQDLTAVEFAILRAICPPSSLFCTGNDAQSIRSSEGADFNAIRNFGDMFPGSVTLRLTENYRSSQEIVDLSNALLKKASGLAYETTSTAHRGETRLKPEFHALPSEREEADFVLGAVLGKLAEGVPPGEIMLLFRSAGQAQVLEGMLRSAGIPYRFLGTSFLQRPHVRDFFSVAEAFADMHNEAAWHRFLGLHPKLEGKLSVLIRGMRKILASKDEKTYDLEEEARRYLADKVYPVYPKLAEFLCHPPRRLFFDPVEKLLKIMEYLNRTGLLKKKYANWSERKKDLQLLIRIAGKDVYVKQTEHGVYEIEDRFDKEFKLDSDAVVRKFERRNEAEKLLTLATVHGAKDLESDFCYLCRVQDYPLENASTPEEFEEELRLLYVAVTRARKQLIITQTAGESSIFQIHSLLREADAGQSERNQNNGESSSVRQSSAVDD